MKKIILTAFVAAAMLTSCGGGDASEKGNWNEEDKKKADEAVAEIDGDLDVFGDHKQDFIDCYLGKIEDKYENFASADADLAGCSAIAEECAEEIMEDMGY